MIKARLESMRGFFGEVITEMKKATWPTRQELISSTMVVIVSLVLLSAYIYICDQVLKTLLGFVMPSR